MKSEEYVQIHLYSTRYKMLITFCIMIVMPKIMTVVIVIAKINTNKDVGVKELQQVLFGI